MNIFIAYFTDTVCRWVLVVTIHMQLCILDPLATARFSSIFSRNSEANENILKKMLPRDFKHRDCDAILCQSFLKISNNVLRGEEG